MSMLGAIVAVEVGLAVVVAVIMFIATRMVFCV